MFWHKHTEPGLDEMNINTVEVEFFFNKQPAIATAMNISEFAIDPASYKIQAITCIIIGSLICVLAIGSFFRPLFTTTEE